MGWEAATAAVPCGSHIKLLRPSCLDGSGDGSKGGLPGVARAIEALGSERVVEIMMHVTHWVD
jgi:hypothetical protein